MLHFWMMKKLRTITVAVLLASAACAWMVSRRPPAEKGALSLEPYLGPGEVLTFSVALPGVPLGLATLTLTPPEEIDGRKITRAMVGTHPNALVARLYRMNDRLESRIDMDLGAPRKFIRIRDHGDKYKKDWIEIDQEQHRAVHKRTKRYIDEKDGKAKLFTYTRAEIDVPENVQDTVSAYYRLRKLELAPGDTIEMPVTKDRESHSMVLRVAAAEELHLERLGVVKALRIEPEAGFSGLFSSDDASEVGGVQPVMWLDADSHALLKLVSPAKIGGKLTAELVGVANSTREDPAPLGTQVEEDESESDSNNSG